VTTHDHESRIDSAMLDLFRVELENHSRVLGQGLVEIEKDQAPGRIEPLMWAAHSIKGAARIVGLDQAVSLAHAMEDVLSATQNGKLELETEDIDVLLQGSDVYAELAAVDTAQIASALDARATRIQTLSETVRGILRRDPPASVTPEPAPSFSPDPSPAAPPPAPLQSSQQGSSVVRVQAESLSRLMGLAGELLVQARSVRSFSTGLLGIKTLQRKISTGAENAAQLLATGTARELSRALEVLTGQSRRALDDLLDQLDGFEQFSRRLERLADNLYAEVLANRMRPFADGLHGFPRMVRDLAKSLGKRVKFTTQGEATEVDREVLEKLEAPLTHILRNAIDHGIERPEERTRAGKGQDGSLVLEAQHRSGMLHVTVTDDGRGIDADTLRRAIVEKGLTTEDLASRMSAAELMDFLFLPGFSTAGSVTEVSGRGVGLDVVLSMVQEVGGSVHLESKPGRGTALHLQLPLTLSVQHSLLVEIGGEPFAMPLTRIDRLYEIEHSALEKTEDRQFFLADGERIGIVPAADVLNLPPPQGGGSRQAVVVISDRMNRYGVIVDRFLDARDLVVIPLDSRLGRIPNVSAGAVREDGTPLLILDVEDMVRSIDHLLTTGKPSKVSRRAGPSRVRKRILVVDDSMTVRELERQLLQTQGYEVSVAVDGVDGWNMLQQEQFDLVVSDIDMPRMNGIDLVKHIRQSPQQERTPVVMISYKDREQDKRAGLAAGATAYLTKGSFHNEGLLRLVRDLIGDA